jgi:predicted house-cleaning NTP pyrophosphatase (Maf/HAM1 superfamily)
MTRLNLPFSCVSPDIDEATETGEDVIQLVRRLSEAKARALASDHANTLIIGSDQALSLDGRILGKPGTHARATEQLSLLTGVKRPSTLVSAS